MPGACRQCWPHQALAARFQQLGLMYKLFSCQQTKELLCQVSGADSAGRATPQLLGSSCPVPAAGTPDYCVSAARFQLLGFIYKVPGCQAPAVRSEPTALWLLFSSTSISVCCFML